MKSQEGGIGFGDPCNILIVVIYYMFLYTLVRGVLYIRAFPSARLMHVMNYDKISITEFQNSNSKFNSNSINLKYSVYIGVRGALLLLSLLFLELPSARLVCYYNLTKFQFQSQNSALASVINNVRNYHFFLKS